MIFAAPLALLGLLSLPLLFVLLRLTPPPPRRVPFPPLALLQAIAAPQRTPLRSPLWLLLLRLACVMLISLGLAQPSLHSPSALPGTGPVLLVIDNGWSTAADWDQRRAAAANLAAAAGRAGRGVAILATAPAANASVIPVPDVMTSTAATQAIAALQPMPWPADRRAALRALQNAPPSTRIYIADGLTDGPDFQPFLAALSPSRILVGGHLPALLLPPAIDPDGGLTLRVLNPPYPARLTLRTATGAIRGVLPVNAGTARIDLPLPVARNLSAITLNGPLTAAGTQLLAGSRHAISAGLSTDSVDADAAFLGPLYFIRRALAPGTQTVLGPFNDLLGAHPDVIILADAALSDAGITKARQYMTEGGTLIRFAGPLTAPRPDALEPDPLLAGDRRLGGVLTWTAPQPIANFPPASLFAGLSPGASITISRQIMADPTRLSAGTVWASLQDGTPLILGTRVGAGYLISVLTSANADWSNLALSGLFPALLSRMTDLAAAAAAAPANLPLSLQAELSAFGTLETPAAPATLPSNSIASVMVSPLHPPGLYTNGNTAMALNLGGHVALPAPATLPGATRLGSAPAPVNFGPDLILAAIILLAADMLVSLALRGLLLRPAAAALSLLCLISLIPARAHAQSAFLQPVIGYISTGDPAADSLTSDALSYLSADVAAHTSAQLGSPVMLNPARDDLAPYPLIYWMILPTTPAPASAACAALVSYTQHGGLLMIDTAGSDAGTAGSGAGFAPGIADALQRTTSCLALPPLTPLTPADVLAHCFYIVETFAGRFTGAPIYLASPAARDPDGVTPVLITQNDFAGAWARDANGNPEQTPIGSDSPEAQRSNADRFGTNLVIYALTGTYKADQSNVASLLNKLGQ